jgi:hypothetical protein
VFTIIIAFPLCFDNRSGVPSAALIFTSKIDFLSLYVNGSKPPGLSYGAGATTLAALSGVLMMIPLNYLYFYVTEQTYLG